LIQILEELLIMPIKKDPAKNFPNDPEELPPAERLNMAHKEWIANEGYKSIRKCAREWQVA
jgi:hypothetical protein